MRLPRDTSSTELIKLLQKLGYQVSRQKGSHIRLTTIHQGEHHITIPNHDPIRLGTLSAIITDIANHFKKTKEEIAKEIF
ncbi:MAG: type II toxin-antitoxin system HicA family toxin [Chitinophagaceae bacterium]